MKPQFENITIKNNKHSFLFFKVEKPSLDAYWHYHPEIELSYVVRGHGTRFIGDAIEPFKEGDLLMCGENLPHDRTTIKFEENVLVYVIQFTKELFTGIKEFESLSHLFDESKYGLQFLDVDHKIAELFINIGRLSNLDRFIALLSLLNELNNHKNRKTISAKFYNNSPKNTKLQDKVSETTRYILKNLDKKLSVEHMADYTNLVPQSFCRWFKNAVGNTFVTYVNTARVEKACQLLLNPTTSIADIAFSVGFESLSHFNRTFLKLKEVSPSQYRKMMFQTTISQSS